MILFRIIAVAYLLSCGLKVHAQKLQAGFDPLEYKELLLIASRATLDKDLYLEAPAHFKLNYQSPLLGFDNRWQLWQNTYDSTAVICVRGSVNTQKNWLSNFYTVMVPAKGNIQLNDSTHFNYALSPNPKAAVHAGWLMSMAYLTLDILPRIDSLYQEGIKNIYLMGHSQGGSITYLLRCYLHSLQAEGKIPNDIQFKTYCSAAPKPGNLYFAYQYEFITANGWGYTIVNTADWVPETPVSIQTVSDFNKTSIFSDIPSTIKNQKFPKNIALKLMFNKIDKPTRRAVKNYRKFLGKFLAKILLKGMKGALAPLPDPSIHFVRTGTIIILQGDADYFIKFPDDNSNVFMHHSFVPYLYLLEHL